MYNYNYLGNLPAEVIVYFITPATEWLFFYKVDIEFRFIIAVQNTIYRVVLT